MTDDVTQEMGDAESEVPLSQPDAPRKIGEYIAVTEETEQVVYADGEFAAADAEASEIEAGTPRESLWARLRRMLSGDVPDVDSPAFIRRVNRLTDAIAFAPNRPANYVLRGELYLSAQLYEAARDDFQVAVELASSQLERSNWGIMAQAMRDRALVGLKKAEKKLLL